MRAAVAGRAAVVVHRRNPGRRRDAPGTRRQAAQARRAAIRRRGRRPRRTSAARKCISRPRASHGRRAWVLDTVSPTGSFAVEPRVEEGCGNHGSCLLNVSPRCRAWTDPDLGVPLNRFKHNAYMGQMVQRVKSSLNRVHAPANEFGHEEGALEGRGGSGRRVRRGRSRIVFNRPGVVREELRERVHAAAKALGFRGPRPRPGARSASGRSNLVAVVVDREPALHRQRPVRPEADLGHRRGLRRGADRPHHSSAPTPSVARAGRSSRRSSTGSSCSASRRTTGSSSSRAAADCPFRRGRFGGGARRRGGRHRRPEGGSVRPRATSSRWAIGASAILSLECDDAERTGFIDDARFQEIRYTTPRARLLGYRDVFEEAGIPPADVMAYECLNDAPSVFRGHRGDVRHRPRAADRAARDVRHDGARRLRCAPGARPAGARRRLGGRASTTCPRRRRATRRSPRSASRWRRRAASRPRMLLAGGREHVILPTELVVRASTAKEQGGRAQGRESAGRESAKR